MPLELQPPLPPVEARSVDSIPEGAEWQYEPKWDGFRCVAFREGKQVDLQSKATQPLGRYFPEVVEAVRSLPGKQFVLDGELAIPEGAGFSFDALLQRIHPAASRVKRLSVETPAIYIVFDLLADEDGRSLLNQPLRERRRRLEAFAARNFAKLGSVRLSPATPEFAQARRWLGQTGATLDGVIAKRLDLGYSPDDREGMQKIKNYRSADCVIGGFRYAAGKKLAGSLLLGLYDENGLLNHVGFTSGLAVKDRAAITEKLEAARGGPGFTGKAPGGPSRWNGGKESKWEPLRPELVVEVSYDHVTGERFRHGTKLLRWRPDKAPGQCTMDQLAQKQSRLLKLLE